MLVGQIEWLTGGFSARIVNQKTGKVVWRMPRYFTSRESAYFALDRKVRSYYTPKGIEVKMDREELVPPVKSYTPNWDNTCITLSKKEIKALGYKTK